MDSDDILSAALSESGLNEIFSFDDVPTVTDGNTSAQAQTPYPNSPSTSTVTTTNNTSSSTSSSVHDYVRSQHVHTPSTSAAVSSSPATRTTSTTIRGAVNLRQINTPVRRLLTRQPMGAARMRSQTPLRPLGGRVFFVGQQQRLTGTPVRVSQSPHFANDGLQRPSPRRDETAVVLTNANARLQPAGVTGESSAATTTPLRTIAGHPRGGGAYYIAKTEPRNLPPAAKRLTRIGPLRPGPASPPYGIRMQRPVVRAGGGVYASGSPLRRMAPTLRLSTPIQSRGGRMPLRGRDYVASSPIHASTPSQLYRRAPTSQTTSFLVTPTRTILKPTIIKKAGIPASVGYLHRFSMTSTTQSPRFMPKTLSANESMTSVAEEVVIETSDRNTTPTGETTAAKNETPAATSLTHTATDTPRVSGVATPPPPHTMTVLSASSKNPTATISDKRLIPTSDSTVEATAVTNRPTDAKDNSTRAMLMQTPPSWMRQFGATKNSSAHLATSVRTMPNTTVSKQPRYQPRKNTTATGGTTSSTVAKADEKAKAPSTSRSADASNPEMTKDTMAEEDDNLGHAETYSEYRPAKLRAGLSHPDSVVETASLSSVQPPDVRYNLSIPEHVIDTAALSALQLEAVIYTCQRHEYTLPSGERCGYLIGDGAGVGKGRTIAAIIFENYLLGRKRALWFSVSSDLRLDAERDFRDVGAGKLKVAALNKFKYCRISGKEQVEKDKKRDKGFKKGVIFATYSSLIGECKTAKSKYRTRLSQILQWCGQDFDGVIVLDECHRAKNLVQSGSGKSTKTGKAVMDLQKALPNARVVYASATGATETRNMAYMSRLGLWGEGMSFATFQDFINAVERRGVGAMELVAMDMKQRGAYLARQLSFHGVSFKIEQVPLTKDFIEIYDESVKLWLEARRQFQIAVDLAEADRTSVKTVWAHFWSAHQRFFKFLCIAAKVDVCVQMTKDALRNGKCVIIGLQSTGEAKTLEQLEDGGGELTDFVSTAKAVFMSLIEKHFPTADNTRRDRVGINDDFDLFSDGNNRLVNRRRLTTKRRAASPLFDIDFGTGVKRSKPSLDVSSAEDKNSDTTSDGDDDEQTKSGRSPATSASSSSDDDSDDEPKGDEDDWLKTLAKQAESSDESSSSGEGGESDESGVSTNARIKASETQSSSAVYNDSVDDEDEGFNPFAVADFDEEDPWAHKQQCVPSSPEKHVAPISATRRKKKKATRKKKQRKEEKVTKSVVADVAAERGTAKHFIQSSQIIQNEGAESSHFYGGSGGGGVSRASVIKAELLTAIERFGERLPPNTLDRLIDLLGGPEKVAEMTGRKGRVVSDDAGEVQYETRNEEDVPLEMLNVAEKERFMSGEKLVAIISEAASSGISLQSDRRAQNTRKRVHITLELPWSADKAIQQFGRSHRSNQVSAPEYVFLISELAGEQRFASTVAKRLESLGALTHGDRRATETRDLSQFNVDTKFGRLALDAVLTTVVASGTKRKQPVLPPPSDYRAGDFITDMRHYLDGVGVLCRHGDHRQVGYAIDREQATIPKFLNRLLGLPVHAQNALFKYFGDTLTALVKQAKRDGNYDLGILDLGLTGNNVSQAETRVFVGDGGTYRTEMHKISVERGVSWAEALRLYEDHTDSDDGFYVSVVPTVEKRIAALLYAIGRKQSGQQKLYCVTRPNTGRIHRVETMRELAKRFVKVTPDEAKSLWESQYNASGVLCQHRFVFGKCPNEAAGEFCEIGRRTRTYFVLSGSVLSVWHLVENILQNTPGRRAVRMQVVRVHTRTEGPKHPGLKIVGVLIPPYCVKPLIFQLEQKTGASYVEAAKNKPQTDNSHNNAT